MNGFAKRGKWGLPGTKELVPGQLTYRQDEGLRLLLDGELSDSLSEATEVDQFSSFGVVHGYSNGEKITLLGVYESSRRASSGQQTTTSHFVNTAILGVHRSIGDPNAKSGAVEFGHLSDWAQLSGVTQTTTSGQVLDSTYSLTYTAPAPMTVAVPDLTLSIRSIAHTEFHRYREIRLTESAYFFAETETGRDINEWFIEVFYPLNRFVDLATDVKNSIVSLYLWFANTGEAESESGPCLVYRSYEDYGAAPEVGLVPHLMLFSRMEVENDAPSILSNWMSMYAKIEEVVELYVGAQMDSSIPITERFSRLLRSLEAYHRIQLQPQLPVNAEHLVHLAKLLEWTKQEFPEEFYDWIMSKLAYAHEPTLRQRMKEMLSEWKQLIDPLFESASEKSKFVDRTLSTRNCRTHPGSDSCSRAFKSHEEWHAVNVLRSILRAYLLRDLGLSRERCIDLVTRTSDYRMSGRSS